MEKFNKITPDTKVLITGVLAWVLLSFAALKLSVVYASNIVLAYFLTYNICCIIYLLYFNVYFKNRFNYKRFFILFIFYNAGIILLDFLYNVTVYIDDRSLSGELIAAGIFGNLVVAHLMFLLLFKITKWLNR